MPLGSGCVPHLWYIMSSCLAIPGDRTIGDAESTRALFAPIASRSHETAMFAYLDPEWRLLGLRSTLSNAVDTIDIPMRAIAADALAFDAVCVVMAHNHPSGDPMPSDIDRLLTRRLARALDAIGVRLHDHLILAGDRCVSLREMRLL